MYVQIGDTWWLHNIGTSMGTPVACIYATLFFAYFERKIIQSKYKFFLLFYVNQIDDILGIQIEYPKNQNAWEEFKKDLRGACKFD